MAGDWIKMRSDLFTHPKVVRISSALKADRLRAVGGLMSVWCLFDAHSVDGKLDGYNFETVDELLNWTGFSAAMASVNWIAQDGESLVLPDFDTHNGQSAKRRAQDADRKRGVRKTSASEADKMRTREEKRREEKKEKEGSSPTSKNGVTFTTWMASLPEDQDAIPADDPVFAYALKAGIPYAFLDLSWAEFHRRMSGNGKRYKSWPQAYRNYVENNYFDLWRITSDGEYVLTTKGLQAKKVAS